MLRAGVQLNARRRWRGKKHVPDSQNRGAVTRRCCGARRPIDHQSLPSRMRRSLPHDFGAPTPKRVPSYTPSPFGRCCPCSLPCYASCRLRSSSFLLSPPFTLLLSSSFCTNRVSTRQLPCLRATLPLTRLLDQDQRWYLGGAIPSVAWPRLVMLADSGDKLQSCRAARLGLASRNSERRFWCGPITTIWHSTMEAVPTMGGAPFHDLIGEPRRRHCFRRGMLRNAARARFTPTPGVATPLSHATPSPAVARRRPTRLFLYLLLPSRSARIFRADEVSLLCMWMYEKNAKLRYYLNLSRKISSFLRACDSDSFVFFSFAILLSKWHVYNATVE